MSFRKILQFLAMFFSAGAIGHAAVTVQDVDNVLGDGSAYLWVEAESAIELGGGPPEAATTGFVLVDNVNPIKSITVDASGNEVINGGLDILPADTNASNGGAILHQIEGGGNAKWNVEFAISATYYLYMHYSFYNRDNNTNYGNEDSIYVPPSFNANSRDDWIGYVGIDADPDDPLEKIGDSNRDGWMPLGKNIVSAGEVETHNSTDENFWEGQFHWSYMDVAVDMDENNAFVGDFGHGIRYEVAEDQIGTVLDFEISTREQYGVIDGLLFSTSNLLLEDFTQEQMDEFFLNMGEVAVPGDFNGNGEIDLGDLDAHSQLIKDGDLIGDVNGDGVTDVNDRAAWTEQFQNSWLGDSNFDFEFGSADFVAVFTTAKYETGQMATYAEGDWNGDMVFDSGDFVAVFTVGGYEKGQRPVANVPEPAGISLLAIGLFACFARRRQLL